MSGKQITISVPAISCAPGCCEQVKQNMISISGLFRFLQFLVAIIAYGDMTSESNYKDTSQFKLVVDAGVVSWIWTIVMIIMLFTNLQLKHIVVPIVTLLGDTTFFFLNVIAGAKAKEKCGTSVPDPSLPNVLHDYCGYNSLLGYNFRALAGASFDVLLGFTFVPSIIFSIIIIYNKQRGVA